MSSKKDFKHVNYQWDDEKVAQLSPPERLVYRSNILGNDQRITNTGGGNTSAKSTEYDPLTADQVNVLWVKGSGGDLRTQYRQDYATYYNTCKRSDSPAMRDSNPTVMLIPGIGMIAWGKNKSESRVTAEFYNCAVEVICGAEAIDEYIALPQQEAFDIEYWALEEAKLRRMPPEQEFARNVAVIIGAGSGIGKATAHRLAAEGAHIVCADLSLEAAQETAKEITDQYGLGIGVAGTGIDNVIVTAGIFFAPDHNGSIPDDKWAITYDVNVKGGFLVADVARKIWQQQNLPGSLVLTTSVNGAVPKKGSIAYDTSKAAANHLVRGLAIELSPKVRVNGLAPATLIKGSAMFPRERVISSLSKYEIPFSTADDTAMLRNKLADFYANRTLIKVPISPEDQAEAAYLLSSNRLSKTTGQILSVDGGLHEAFLR